MSKLLEFPVVPKPKAYVLTIHLKYAKIILNCPNVGVAYQKLKQYKADGYDIVAHKVEPA